MGVCGINTEGQGREERGGVPTSCPAVRLWRRGPGWEVGTRRGRRLHSWSPEARVRGGAGEHGSLSGPRCGDQPLRSQSCECLGEGSRPGQRDAKWEALASPRGKLGETECPGKRLRAAGARAGGKDKPGSREGPERAPSPGASTQGPPEAPASCTFQGPQHFPVLHSPECPVPLGSENPGLGM